MALVRGLVAAACILLAAGQPMVDMAADGPAVYLYDPEGPFGEYTCEATSPSVSTACGCNKVFSGNAELRVEIFDGFVLGEDVLECDACHSNLLQYEFSGNILTVKTDTDHASTQPLAAFLAALGSVRLVTTSRVSGARGVRASWLDGDPGFQVCRNEVVSVTLTAADECMPGAADCVRFNWPSPTIGATHILPLGLSIDCGAGACACGASVDGAIILLKSGFVADDTLSVPGCPTCTLTNEVLSDAAGFLMFQWSLTDAAGPMTVEDVQAALGSLEITLKADEPQPRRQKLQLTWNLGLAAYLSETGSFYKVDGVGGADYSDGWDTAQRACAADTFFGMTGYLAALTTPFEHFAVGSMAYHKKGGDATFWVGGTDLGNEGTYRWITGPEGCPPYNFLASEFGERSACRVFPIDSTDAYDTSCDGTQCTEGSPVDFFDRSTGGFSDFLVLWAKPTGLEWWFSLVGSDVTGYICEWNSAVQALGGLSCPMAVLTGAACALPYPTDDACDSCGASCADGTPAGQECVDPDTSPGALNDWECHCPVGTTGTGDAEPAQCEVDECDDVTCLAGQACHDLIKAWNATGTWECRCDANFTGAPVMGGNATCTLNECAPRDSCPSCAPVCGPLQECRDRNDASNSTDTWECRCTGGATGVPELLGNATCALDECTAACASCLLPRSCAAGQSCRDDTPWPEDTGDWECYCLPPFSSATAATQGNATCALNECDAVAVYSTCLTENCSVGRTCLGRDQAQPGRQDWVCDCDSVSSEDAPCVFNECTAYSPCAAGQRCTDADTGTLLANLHTFVCECVPPLVGDAATGSAAVCGTPEPPVPSAAPEPVLPQEDAVETAGGAAAATAALAGGNIAALQTVVVMRECREGSRSYPFILHPTGILVFGEPAAGAVVGNFAVSAAVGLLGWALVQAFSVLRGRLPAALAAADTQGLLRYPSAPLTVVLFLYQGSSLASMELVVRNPNLPAFFVGLGGAAFCAGVPFMVLRAVVRDVPAAAFYLKDPEPAGRAVRFLVGDGEWVSRVKRKHWVERWGCTVRTYKQETAWFLFLDLCAAFAISAMQSSPVGAANPTGCGYVKLFTGVVFAMLLGLELWIRPHCHARNNWFDALAACLQSAGMFLMAGAYLAGGDRGHWGFAAAGAVLLGAIVVISIRTALDLLGLLWVVVKRRRRRLQDLAFACSWSEEGVPVDLTELESDVPSAPTAMNTTYTFTPTSVVSFREAAARTAARVTSPEAPPLDELELLSMGATARHVREAPTVGLSFQAQPLPADQVDAEDISCVLYSPAVADGDGGVSPCSEPPAPVPPAGAYDGVSDLHSLAVSCSSVAPVAAATTPKRPRGVCHGALVPKSTLSFRSRRSPTPHDPHAEPAQQPGSMLLSPTGSTVSHQPLPVPKCTLSSAGASRRPLTTPGSPLFQKPVALGSSLQATPCLSVATPPALAYKRTHAGSGSQPRMIL